MNTPSHSRWWLRTMLYCQVKTPKSGSWGILPMSGDEARSISRTGPAVSPYKLQNKLSPALWYSSIVVFVCLMGLVSRSSSGITLYRATSALIVLANPHVAPALKRTSRNLLASRSCSATVSPPPTEESNSFRAYWKTSTTASGLLLAQNPTAATMYQGLAVVSR